MNVVAERRRSLPGPFIGRRGDGRDAAVAARHHPARRDRPPRRGGRARSARARDDPRRRAGGRGPHPRAVPLRRGRDRPKAPPGHIVTRSACQPPRRSSPGPRARAPVVSCRTRHDRHPLGRVVLPPIHRGPAAPPGRDDRAAEAPRRAQRRGVHAPGGCGETQGSQGVLTMGPGVVMAPTHSSGHRGDRNDLDLRARRARVGDRIGADDPPAPLGSVPSLPHAAARIEGEDEVLGSVAPASPSDRHERLATTCVAVARATAGGGGIGDAEPSAHDRRDRVAREPSRGKARAASAGAPQPAMEVATASPATSAAADLRPARMGPPSNRPRSHPTTPPA